MDRHAASQEAKQMLTLYLFFIDLYIINLHSKYGCREVESGAVTITV